MIWIEISVILRSNSKVYLTYDIETTERYEAEAREQTKGPQLPVSSIQTVKMSPVKTKVTIQGRITQVSENL